MATFTLSVTNALTLDGRDFRNAGSATLKANQVTTQTRDLTTTYAGLGCGRFHVIINKGEDEVYIRLTMTGPNYFFFPLPVGAHMVLPQFYESTGDVIATSIEGRTATSAGRIFIISGI